MAHSSAFRGLKYVEKRGPGLQVWGLHGISGGLIACFEFCGRHIERGRNVFTERPAFECFATASYVCEGLNT